MSLVAKDPSQAQPEDILDRLMQTGARGLVDDQLLNLLPTAVYFCDQRGPVLWWNQRAVDLWGEEPPAGNASGDFIPTLTKYAGETHLGSGTQDASARSLQPGLGRSNDERTFERPDGTRRIVSVSMRSVLDADGKTLGAIYILEDITDRKAAEEKLQRSEDRFASVMSSLPGLAWIKDIHGRYVYANEIASEAFGCAPGELQGKTDDDIFPAQTAAQFRTNDQQALHSASSIQAVETLQHPDGTLHYSLVSKFPIPGPDGRPAFVGGVAFEITDRLQAEEALRGREDHLRAVVETTPECIKLLATDGSLIDMNPAGLAMIEANQLDDVKGQCVFNLIAPDDRHKYQHFHERICRGERGTLEFDMVSLRGTRRHMETRAAPLQGPHGEAWHLAITHDVSERNAAEQRLRSKNTRLRLLSEAAEILLRSLDPDAMLRQLFERIAPELELHAYFNYMVTDAGNALHLESCHGISVEIARNIQRLDFGQAICGTVAQTGVPMSVAEIQQSTDSRVQLVKSLGIRAYACNPLTAGERLLGTLSFATRTKDEFDEHELEFLRVICHYVAVACERNRLIRRLQEADRRKDEFLATLAHELRNPLAPIRNSLHILRMSGEDPTSQRVHEMMERQVNHLVHLVDDLLEVSRITRGTVQLRTESVDVASIIQNALDTSRPLIEAGGHAVKVSLPAPPVTVLADAIRVAQVLSNLLNNAAKYTEPGGQIGISVRTDGTEAAICVRDTGIGISAEMLPRVFEMFTQVDRDHKRSQGGLGIGLALAKALVEMLGGRIEACSEGIGRGSEFTIYLPLAESQAANAAGKSDARDESAASRRRILIVDDNRDAASSLAILLRLTGNEVETANDGPTALAVVRSFRPSIVLLDLGMPGMSGFEVAEHLQQLPEAEGITLAALTGWGQEDDRRRTREAGFHHHFVKPVELNALSPLLTACSPQ